ncbi:hypothetical protein BD410DRAFT_80880 [Rickenella mellea]|uniref:Uncharacterized protein n=1 Tax=Rickenella mellea TaxID=50990 RepID=A0A4Y7PKC0_9AGAM|nr:hypothetical protein BD410DRAFT_80880 [Rickenella mellea]
MPHGNCKLSIENSILLPGGAAARNIRTQPTIINPNQRATPQGSPIEFDSEDPRSKSRRPAPPVNPEIPSQCHHISLPMPPATSYHVRTTSTESR